jgi:hypothetical protein
VGHLSTEVDMISCAKESPAAENEIVSLTSSNQITALAHARRINRQVMNAMMTDELDVALEIMTSKLSKLVNHQTWFRIVSKSA